VSTGYAASFESAMRAALAEAAAAAGAVARAAARAAAHPGRPDVPVGAVVLDPAGAVAGRGHNEREATGDPTAHAEILAIRAAARARGGWRLGGCTLVVTLEPCTMCAGAVLAARMARLVYGAADPRAGAAGSLWDVLRDRRTGQQTEVIGGVLAGDCAAVLREFFAGRRHPD
jgi:tRNA(adenine34) deaminase